MRETEVVAAVSSYAADQGFACVAEFPLLGRIADLFAIRPDGESCVAIECKEKDWRRALRQARTYLAAVDEVYVALPSRAVTDKVTELAMTLGIGVLGVEEDFEIAVVASFGNEPVPSLRARTVMQFNQRTSKP